jgi:hypothetical protein
MGVTVEFKPEEYGKYATTTMLGKFEKMAMGPALPGNDIDDWLYSAFYPEQPQNRSHVADAELNKMLIAQRRELDPKKRLAIVHDIQRYLADKAYYVYLPSWPWYITHAPQVKDMKYHDGVSLGHRLMFGAGGGALLLRGPDPPGLSGGAVGEPDLRGHGGGPEPRHRPHLRLPRPTDPLLMA